MHILSGKKSFCMFKRYSFKIAFESYCAILITWTQIIMRFLKHLSYIYRNSDPGKWVTFCLLVAATYSQELEQMLKAYYCVNWLQVFNNRVVIYLDVFSSK